MHGLLPAHTHTRTQAHTRVQTRVDASPPPSGPLPPERAVAPYRWCAPYPPLAECAGAADWPPSLVLLWQACRAARSALVALESEAAEHPFDTDLWRLVNASHSLWLDLESRAHPLMAAVERERSSAAT